MRPISMAQDPCAVNSAPASAYGPQPCPKRFVIRPISPVSMNPSGVSGAMSCLAGAALGTASPKSLVSAPMSPVSEKPLLLMSAGQALSDALSAHLSSGSDGWNRRVGRLSR